MDRTLNPFYSTPTAILLGSSLIAVSILIHGGYIKVGKLSEKTTPTTATTTSQPTQAKTETDIIKGLKTYAAKANLDQNKFAQCLDSGNKASLVSSDQSDGEAVGVNGTPAFFVNGRLIAGAVPYAQFKKVIDEELSGSAPAGTERKTVAVGNLSPQGSINAKVTVVEFSDYQCPFCERFFNQTEGQLKKEYIDSGKVVFYYRDFPLTQIHPGAQKGAEAARCAGDQGKYWQYHDIVFQNQKDIF